MKQMRFSAMTRLSAILIAVGAWPIAGAHGPVDRAADLTPVEARLFVADNQDGSVLVVDLPAADKVLRLATPPFIISVGRPANSRYVFALRGRSTDRDFVTVIDSGFEAGGKARTPYIARSFVAGTSPGGTDQGNLLTIGGKPALFMDDDGELLVFGSDDFSGLGEIPVRRYKLAGPDHLHMVEAGEYFYVGHLIKGLLQIIDKETGEEVARIEACPILYGATQDEATGRLFFSCQKHVLVVGSRGDELHKELGRIPYPGRQRIGPFLHGRDRVLWGYTESAQAELQRLDLATEPYVIESLTVDASIQQNTSPDGEYLLVYSRSGMLDIRHGGTGELIHQVQVSRAFDQAYHEHVDKALLPDIRFLGDRVFISLPHEGRIAEVQLQSGEVTRYIDVGGQPTRMVAVSAASIGSL
jgi:DNA-binding beta-propeller fold protein YncE